MSHVKGGARSAKARETRRRIREAGAALFAEHGYGATTLQDVAGRAGVAVQTIYFTFGNKRALLKEIVDVSIAGDDEPIVTMDRPWFQGVLDADDAGTCLRRLVAGTAETLARVALIVEMLRTAATVDPDIRALWPDDADPRFTVHSAAAAALVAKPGIRDGVTAAHAADVLFGLLSPELYLVFVRDRGWSPEQWESWTRETLRAALC